MQKAEKTRCVKQPLANDKWTMGLVQMVDYIWYNGKIVLYNWMIVFDTYWWLYLIQLVD